MDFLLWHYSAGLGIYLRRWFYYLAYINHYFSLSLLLSSLFSPWKRLLEIDTGPGFNPARYLEQLTFNLISRGLGAIVRSLLFITGVFILAWVFFLGVIGLLIWLAFPPLGMYFYYTRDPGQKRFLKNLTHQLLSSPSPVLVLSAVRAGRFLLTHTGLTANNLTVSQPIKLPPDFSPASFHEVMQKFVELGTWSKDYLREYGVDFADLLLAAAWWDRQFANPGPLDGQLRFPRPGIGLELLFGYTPRLNQYVTDLGLPQAFYHHLVGREEIVSRIERTLISGESVILVGQPGVGKKTILLEFARRAMAGELSAQMAYKRVLELDPTFLLSETIDLNQKKAKLSEILAEAAAAGNVILVVKDLHRLTNPDLEGIDITDILEKYLEPRELKLIVISAQRDYERFIAPHTRLRKFLVPVEAAPVSKDDALLILLDAASRWETKARLIFTVQALRAIISGSDRYITDIPFPEKSLELLDHTVAYTQRQRKTLIGVDEVNAVIAEITGISLVRLTESEKKTLTNLEDILHRRLVGQDTAVSLIAKSLRARSVGAKDDKRPIGSFLFLGPTGVGKTQTAKTLAEIYYGSQESILRFDMAEYAGAEGLPRLIGSVQKNLPGSLTTAIKNRPASLLLLDEIEKAPPEVYNLFLTLLDEGSMTDAFGRFINCRHLFVIATSNAAAVYIRQLVSDKVSPSQMQKLVVDYVQKNNIFSPEFLNRFDGVVVFAPLSSDQLTEIAAILLSELARTLEQQKGIHLEISPPAIDKLARDGYEPEFGARPMRRIVDITIGDLIGRAVLAGSVKPGDRHRLTVDTSGFALQKL